MILVLLSHKEIRAGMCLMSMLPCNKSVATLASQMELILIAPYFFNTNIPIWLGSSTLQHQRLLYNYPGLKPEEMSMATFSTPPLLAKGILILLRFIGYEAGNKCTTSPFAFCTTAFALAIAFCQSSQWWLTIPKSFLVILMLRGKWLTNISFNAPHSFNAGSDCRHLICLEAMREEYVNFCIKVVSRRQERRKKIIFVTVVNETVCGVCFCSIF